MLSNRWSGVLRGLVIVAVLGVWLAIGAIGGQAQGKLSTVQTNDSAAFLPSSAESTRAAEKAQAFVSDESLPALVVAVPTAGGAVTPEQLQLLQDVAADLPGLPLPGAGPDDPQTVGDALTGEPVVVPSQDGEAAMIVASLDASQASNLMADDERVNNVVVAEVRAELETALADSGLQAWVTGPAGFVADLVNAFGGIDTVLLLVALGAVLIILAIVYRSPILPFIVILTAVFALCLAGLVVYLLADAGVLTLNGQAQGILSILVVGAAVDYSLLVVARYREELRIVQSPYTAVRRALRASIEPVAASAGTVIAGLLCLLLSDLGSNRSLGPVGAIGIAAAFLAALTLLPAMLVLGGRRSRGIFWPQKPTYDPAAADEGATPAPVAADPSTQVAGEGARDLALAASHDVEVHVAGHGIWSRVASFVGRRDRAVWIVTALVLAGCAAFVPTFQAEGTSDSDVFLTQVDSVDGEQALEEHFGGVGVQPAIVIAPQEDLDAVLQAATATDGVASAAAVTEAGTGGAPGAPAQGPPLVVDGDVRVDVVTEDPSDTNAATQTVAALRDAVHEVSPEALVGGASAERLDTQIAGDHDLRVIVPVVLVVILLILMLLLRSILAPVLLMAANVLSFGAALGVAALVFNHVLDFPGADPTVPLYAFCFLVALGVDYSIFLMTRVREESGIIGTRRGTLRALAVTGSVITSAGVVLAATFAALGVIPLLFLAQLAFIVAFGVLVDTLIVRSLLVPALVHDVGRVVWWPGSLRRAAP
ncbi:MMPL family transporter [Oerskovia enterophila]|uniref:Membrane protein YdgH n=1 Tax=Oerskovia enterophila TaxID=43678 RepID=A0ABX2Y305_9CELL|nr:MMPL family transporter [Oerskovia enterophila]OCI30942.1 putative membrane protein YdgH [Oerskovia enterophila]